MSFWFSRVWLSWLAILVFTVDVGTNLYTNLQTSDRNFVEERDAKLFAIKNSPEALRRLSKAEKVAVVFLKKSEQMVESNGLAIGRVKNGQRDGSKIDLWDDKFDKAVKSTALSDTSYTNYIVREEKPIWDEYDRKVERKKLSTFTGLTTAISVGVLLPVFSLFLMFMSTKPYDKSFKDRCKVGGYGAQFLSSIVTGIAIYEMFGNILLAIGFGLVLLWCAPLLYEAVALERQRRIAERAEKLKAELEKEKAELEVIAKQQAVEQEETDKRKKTANKGASEQSRMKNLIATAKKFANPEKSIVPKGVSKEPEKTAAWFVENGEPYGLQIKLAAHCGESRSSFNRMVEQKRLLLGKSESKNGKMDEVGG